MRRANHILNINDIFQIAEELKARNEHLACELQRLTEEKNSLNTLINKYNQPDKVLSN